MHNQQKRENQSNNHTNHKVKDMWKLLTSHQHSSYSKSTPVSGNCSSSLPTQFGEYMPPKVPKDNRRFSSTDMYDYHSPLFSSSSSSLSSQSRKKLTRRRKKRGIEGKFQQDVLGVTFLQICYAKDLPTGKKK